jgi:hypothetical protein
VVPLLVGGLVLHAVAEPATAPFDQRLSVVVSLPPGKARLRRRNGCVSRNAPSVFSSRLIMEEGEPILLVFHDDNGDWQFLSSNEENVDEIAFIHLGHVLDVDPSVGVLEDLPSGWKAWRWNVGDDWVREPTPSDQPSVEG